LLLTSPDELLDPVHDGAIPDFDHWAKAGHSRSHISTRRRERERERRKGKGKGEKQTIVNN
jgi:hypothetical protein